MSSNSNHINNTIHTGNYEEFFILYMDNELTVEQREMVETFLEAHPELRAELDLLLSTQLPAETISFDKESLLSSSMKLSSAEEELLLYIDNELPATEKNRIELELASNQDYQRQHSILLQTRLDAAEVIPYPNKAELYHHSTRIVGYRFYMRIAAAVLLVAGMGTLYYLQNDYNQVSNPGVAVVPQASKTQAPNQSTEPAITNSTGARSLNANLDETAMVNAKKDDANERLYTNSHRDLNNHQVAYTAVKNTDQTIDPVYEHAEQPMEKATTAIHMNAAMEEPTSFDPSKQIINNSRVTSALAQRNTSTKATETEVPKNDVAENKESKGSFKSFLRKATRMIERKTGIDPTNGDDEELLVGALAVKLK